jgi:hypothetical protein
VLALNADALTVVKLSRVDPGALRAAADTSFLLGTLGDRRPGDPLWWVGIVLSTLLVSLGAPFWHDLLEALFGLKNRVRAQAEKVTAETPPIAEVRHRIGPDDVAIVRGPAEDAVP